MQGLTSKAATHTAAALMTTAEFRARLGGMSDRKFAELRAAGIVPAPLELGPRAPRWTEQDLAETLQRLPRRATQAEPERLSAGRRARIERLKGAAANTGAKEAT